MHTAPSPACGTAGSVNVMAYVRRVVPGLRPAVIVNAPSAPPPSGSIMGGQASQELVDWGRQIAATRVVRWADHCLPGIGWAHDAWQLGRALADVRRGDVMQAARRVPAALVLGAAGDALLEAWPSSREACARQEAAVLLIAVAVWATRQPDGLRDAPLSLPQRALLGSLRGIRMLSGAVGALHHRRPSAPPDACGEGSCITATPGRTAAAISRNQTAGLFAAGPYLPDPAFVGGFGVFPAVSARSASGKGAKARPARPQAPARPAQRRLRPGIRISRNRKQDPAASGLPARKESDAFLIRGAARNSGAMAGQAHAANADSARESMTGPLSHSSSGVFKPPDLDDGRRAADPGASTQAPTAPASPRTRPGPVPAVPPAASRAPPASVMDSPQCMRFHDVRQTSSQLRAQRLQDAVARYCIHPAARERFTNTFRFPGAELPGAGPRTIAHPIRERIPKALRGSAIQIVRRPGSSRLPPPGVVGHHAVYAVVTVALLEGPVGTPPTDRATSLLRNTFRLMEHVDLGGTRHLFIAYLVAREEAGTAGIATGLLDVGIDETGAVSVRDARRDWTLGAPDLDGLVAGLQDVSGLMFDPGPDHRHPQDPDAPSRVIPEPAANLRVTEGEQRSGMPPHDRLPYDRTLGFINPVVIPRTAHHPALELYANSFTVTGESLVYADDNRVTGVLRFGCPTTGQNGSAILHCPTPADPAFARRFGLQPGYVYNLDALAAQLESRGMVRVPDPGSADDAARHPEATTTVPGDEDATSAGPALCAACFTFREGVLHYRDPHGQRGRLQFDRTLERRERYVLGDIERAEDRAFAFGNGFDRLSRYTEVEIVQWLVGEGYERVAVAGTQERGG